MSSFTNMTILDCNRLNSTEYKGNNNENPALWTNKIGSGVQVNVGDQIQVQSVFVSEDGAGDEVIEFKNVLLGKTKDITYLTPTYGLKNSDFASGYEKTGYTETTDTIDLVDNKASIVISMYKNANGENYVQLPRKFSCVSAHKNAVQGDKLLWFSEENSNINGGGSASSVYGLYGGLPYHQVQYFNGERLMETSVESTRLYYCLDDYYYFAKGINSRDDDSQSNEHDFYKIKNDNSRFQIFVAKDTYWNGSGGIGTTLPPASYWKTEPSDIEYLKYTKKIDLEVKEGFNTPKQLRKTSEQHITTWSGAVNDYAMIPPRDLSTYLESETYKTFVCSNPNDFQSDNYNAWNTTDAGGANVPTQPVVNWLNVHNVIGVKRPELFIKGRAVSDAMGGASIYETFEYGDYIKTTIPFTTTNCELLRDLFIEQGYHSELFENEFNEYSDRLGSRVTTANSRFLHMASNMNLSRLGTDDISGSLGTYNDRGGNYISVPLFFKYDPALSTTFSDGTGSACYGALFSYPHTHTGVPYIKILIGAYSIGHPTDVQPPNDYFLWNDTTGTGTKLYSGTKIGWDKHFTAYSTCCIAITDGKLLDPWRLSNPHTDFGEIDPFWKNEINTTRDNTASRASAPLDVSDKIKRVYLGANVPTISFDAVSNRFSISDLHTPEYVGNPADAGGSNADDAPVKVNDDAGDAVYKINKRQNNSNWTTALQPYTNTQIPSASGTTAYDLNILNYNISPWKIFDSQSGIIINDFGFNENDWQDGLWGIMGFTWTQFNSSFTGNNDITDRLTETQSKTLPYAFTNANVSAGETINFNVNGWGVPMYDLQLPCPSTWNGSGTHGAKTQSSLGTREGFKIQNYPAITEKQTSIGLVANNLPRKMLRPYYCVRSDILDTTHYLGGSDSGLPLPVVGIVNKINGYGDFFFSDTPSSMIFTATKRKVITSITTSIHYPDQTFAKVNRDSAVIYKIIKQQPAEQDILNEIMKS